MRTEFRDCASRLDNAKRRFLECCESNGFTRTEAEKILAVYQKARVLKLSLNDGAFHIKHGVFMDADIMRNALAQ